MTSRITKKSNALDAVICYCCGELYALKDFSEQDPLEVCGECGAEEFLPCSRDCLRGYTCLEQYEGLRDLLPLHLRSALPLELCPQPSPFVRRRLPPKI
jgi:hypothetical protein